MIRLALEKDINDSVSSEFSIDNPTLDGNVLIVGNQTLVISSEKMKDLLETVDKAAQAPISVVINGETGVGKELIAEAIHRRGPRESPPHQNRMCGPSGAPFRKRTFWPCERRFFRNRQRQKRIV